MAIQVGGNVDYSPLAAGNAAKFGAQRAGIAEKFAALQREERTAQAVEGFFRGVGDLINTTYGIFEQAELEKSKARLSAFQQEANGALMKDMFLGNVVVDQATGEVIYKEGSETNKLKAEYEESLDPLTGQAFGRVRSAELAGVNSVVSGVQGQAAAQAYQLAQQEREAAWKVNYETSMRESIASGDPTIFEAAIDARAWESQEMRDARKAQAYKAFNYGTTKNMVDQITQEQGVAAALDFISQAEGNFTDEDTARLKGAATAKEQELQVTTFDELQNYILTKQEEDRANGVPVRSDAVLRQEWQKEKTAAGGTADGFIEDASEKRKEQQAIIESTKTYEIYDTVRDDLDGLKRERAKLLAEAGADGRYNGIEKQHKADIDLFDRRIAELEQDLKTKNTGTSGDAGANAGNKPQFTVAQLETAAIDKMAMPDGTVYSAKDELRQLNQIVAFGTPGEQKAAFDAIKRILTKGSPQNADLINNAVDLFYKDLTASGIDPYIAMGMQQDTRDWLIGYLMDNPDADPTTVGAMIRDRMNQYTGKMIELNTVKSVAAGKENANKAAAIFDSGKLDNFVFIDGTGKVRVDPNVQKAVEQVRVIENEFIMRQTGSTKLVASWAADSGDPSDVGADSIYTDQATGWQFNVKYDSEGKGQIFYRENERGTWAVYDATAQQKNIYATEQAAEGKTNTDAGSGKAREPTQAEKDLQKKKDAAYKAAYDAVYSPGIARIEKQRTDRLINAQEYSAAVAALKKQAEAAGQAAANAVK